MQFPMEGVRILEVAQYTFVPAAGAVLADWGAEVIKVEHAEKGDAQRGLSKVMGQDSFVPGSSFHPIMEGPNRGKRSIGLSLEKPQALEVLHDLIRQSDVFLTNYLPRVRTQLKIDLEDVRAVNPDIIYARGSAFGHRGAESNKGGYDSTAFWARGGSAAGVTPPDSEYLSFMPAGAYGDSISGMALAGGIAAALFARATTGKTSVVDTSLLSVGAWATQFSTNLAMLLGGPLPQVAQPSMQAAATNPLVGSYRTLDGRWIMLTMLQPGKYWAEFCNLVGRPELAADERFNTAEKISAHTSEAIPLVSSIIRERTYADWVSIFAEMEGPWAAVQDAWDVANDASLRVNGYIAPVIDAEGCPRELVTSPVQFDETPPLLSRAPLFAEHTDSIICSLGRTDEELIDLKVAGAVT